MSEFKLIGLIWVALVVATFTIFWVMITFDILPMISKDVRIEHAIQKTENGE